MGSCWCRVGGGGGAHCSVLARVLLSCGPDRTTTASQLTPAQLTSRCSTDNLSPGQYWTFLKGERVREIEGRSEEIAMLKAGGLDWVQPQLPRSLPC